MRFFNDGFAVAQDGSPVVGGPLTETSSATMTVAASSVGGLVFPTNDYDNNRDTTGTQFGVRGSGNAGGLPRFSIAGGLRDGNRSSPPATPAGLWKENMQSDYRSNRQYELERYWAKSRSVRSRELVMWQTITEEDPLSSPSLRV